MALTVSDIVSQYGARYENKGQNINDVFTAFKRERTIPTYATKRFTTNDVIQLAQADINNVLQPFHKTFSTKGDTTIVANEITLRKVKVDISIDPDDIEQTWLGFMADLNDGERANWPIVRFIWEKWLAERLAREAGQALRAAMMDVARSLDRRHPMHDNFADPCGWPKVTKYDMQAQGFWRQLWPLFIEALKAEAEQHALQAA